MEPALIIAAIAALILLILLSLGRPSTTRARTPVRLSGHRGRAAPATRYVGDFTGQLTVEYSPNLDGAPDPGEVVWAWVPYEEDHTRGKDRPVLLVGRDGPWLLGLPLSSQSHSAPAAGRGPHQPRWLDIGSGPWDSQRRASAVRLDRIVRVDPGWVRREGAILDPKRFNTVVHSLKGL